jgi:CheY-like chemotaxis protein
MTHVLVIDDESAVLRNVGLMLEMAGYPVRLVSSGVEGLSSVRAEPPFLVICDLAMAGMTGWDVLEMLQSDRTTRDIPVALITGMRDETIARRLADSGAVGVLHKPFSHDDLMALVERYRPD